MEAARAGSIWPIPKGCMNLLCKRCDEVHLADPERMHDRVLAAVGRGLFWNPIRFGSV